ncbi:RNA recognition motif domain-containing protein [Mucilaginibacter sp. HD30]
MPEWLSYPVVTRPQFQKQVLTYLPHTDLKKLSILPTCRTKYYNYDHGWEQLDAENFTNEQNCLIIDCLLSNPMIKLFVVGFPKEMDEPKLHTFFSDFGDVVAVKIITEQDTGMSKGYAFVDFMDEVGARLAIKELDGSSFEDRTLNVRLADKQPRPRTSLEKPVAERQYEKVRQVSSKRPRRKS